MAIISIPADVSSTAITCAICKRRITWPDATAGGQAADGQQMFACTKHIWNRTDFLMGWLDFMANQRRFTNVSKD